MTSQSHLTNFVQNDMRVIFKTLRVLIRSACSQCILANLRVNFEISARTYSQHSLADSPQTDLRVNFGKSARTVSQCLLAQPPDSYFTLKCMPIFIFHAIKTIFSLNNKYIKKFEPPNLSNSKPMSI